MLEISCTEQIMAEQQSNKWWKGLWPSRPAEGNDFRYEKKYLIPMEELEWLKARVESKGLQPIYHPRYVNNIYADTFNLHHLNENIEGVSRRQKMRMRWYGDSLGELKITGEFKIKQEDVNRKHTQKLGVYHRYNAEDIESIFQDARAKWLIKEPDLKPILGSYRVTLENRYARTYLLTADKKIRLTIDTEMSYTNLINGISARDLEYAIVELKCGVDHPIVNDLLPYNLSKSSKYVEGLMRTDPHYRLAH